jgi:hypothetical protein
LTKAAIISPEFNSKVQAFACDLFCVKLPVWNFPEAYQIKFSSLPPFPFWFIVQFSKF